MSDFAKGALCVVVVMIVLIAMIPGIGQAFALILLNLI